MKGLQKNMAWRQKWENNSRNAMFGQYIGLCTDSSHFGTIFRGSSRGYKNISFEHISFLIPNACDIRTNRLNVDNSVPDKRTSHLYGNIYFIATVWH